MAPMRWDPLRELLERRQSGGRGDERAATWSPPMDLYETTDRYVLTVEACGLAREDIALEVDQDVLTVRGTRVPPPREGVEYQRVERGQGPFARSFTFADPIEADRISAEFADGVLTVTIPKTSRPEARRIPVR
jgi:HSP20 family protein